MQDWADYLDAVRGWKSSHLRALEKSAQLVKVRNKQATNCRAFELVASGCNPQWVSSTFRRINVYIFNRYSHGTLQPSRSRPQESNQKHHQHPL